jgi:sucrose phosphorylase
MMEETFDFIRAFSERATRAGLEVLVEIHSYFERQIEIAQHVQWVYDFALPPLVLHAFFNSTARALKHWIQIRPHNCLTVLDTHDGIGVIDIGADAQDRLAKPGLVPETELSRLVQQIHANSNGESLRATGVAASNLDLYQVNCTFYDALGRDDLRYLLGRAIQFFLPGVPQVYYVGLLAGINDAHLLARTQVGRDINRRYYTRGEVDHAVHKPVVADLFELIRLRNTHPAFNGAFQVAASTDETLDLRWHSGADFAHLKLDLHSCDYRLEFSRDGRTERLVFRSRPHDAA